VQIALIARNGFWQISFEKGTITMNANTNTNTVAMFTYSTEIDTMQMQRGEGAAARAHGDAQEAAYMLAHAAAWERGQIVATDKTGAQIVQQQQFAALVGWSKAHVNKACTVVKKHPLLSALVGRDGKGRLVVKDDQVVPTIVAVIEAAMLVGRSGINSLYNDLKDEPTEKKQETLEAITDRYFVQAMCERNGYSVEQIVAAVLAKAEATVAEQV
jgi:hypothetical protein